MTKSKERIQLERNVALKAPDRDDCWNIFESCNFCPLGEKGVLCEKEEKNTILKQFLTETKDYVETVGFKPLLTPQEIKACELKWSDLKFGSKIGVKETYDESIILPTWVYDVDEANDCIVTICNDPIEHAGAILEMIVSLEKKDANWKRLMLNHCSFKEIAWLLKRNNNIKEEKEMTDKHKKGLPIEINWELVPQDTPIIIENNKFYYFDSYDKCRNIIFYYPDGKTSWTNKGAKTYCVGEHLVKLAKQEDIDKYKKVDEYVPFENMGEVLPHIDRCIMRKTFNRKIKRWAIQTSESILLQTFDGEVVILSLAKCFEYFVFLDNTPFGKKKI